MMCPAGDNNMHSGKLHFRYFVKWLNVAQEWERQRERDPDEALECDTREESLKRMWSNGDSWESWMYLWTHIWSDNFDLLPLECDEKNWNSQCVKTETFFNCYRINKKGKILLIKIIYTSLFYQTVVMLNIFIQYTYFRNDLI